MQGVWVTDWQPFEQLRLQELPLPEIGEREVLLRVAAAGVSFATSLVVQGKYQRKPPLPFVPGTEVAGTVARVGSQVTRFKPGDRVCAVLDWGGLAEYAAAKEVNCYGLPEAIDFPRAIAFTNSYATSAAALTWSHLLNVQPDHLIDYREREFRDEVLALTGGRGVNAVYDPVGGEVFLQSLRCMAPEARIMPVGFAGGDIPNIPANLLLVKNLTVCGLNLGYYYGWSPQDMRYEFEDRMRATMQQLFDWCVAGKIKPRNGAIYPLADFQQAMADVLGRQAIGRVAVVM